MALKNVADLEIVSVEMVNVGARLIPVSEWSWTLYQVDYYTDDLEDTASSLTKYIVSTDTHVEGEVCEYGVWPRPSLTFARWVPIKENVARPRQIGTVYGQRIDESGWSAGERMFKEGL